VIFICILIFSTFYSPNSTWLDSTRRTAQLDSLDTTSSTGSTRRERLAT